jgi:hypothetical protein
MSLIDKEVGKSIYFLNIFTELVKARKEDQTFDDILELKVILIFCSAKSLFNIG